MQQGTRFTMHWYVILIVAGAITLVWVKNTDYSEQSRVELQARKVDCSFGQIPLDCVKADKPVKRTKESSKHGRVAR